MILFEREGAVTAQLGQDNLAVCCHGILEMSLHPLYQVSSLPS